MINYYAIQVKTRGEIKYIRLARALHPELRMPIHFPQRALDVRRAGKIRPSKAAVFPGYIFAEIEDTDSMYRYHWCFRRTDGFFRFLRSNQNIAPLQGKDLEVVLHFVKNVGPLAGKSKVIFDKDSRIVVIEGPLSGLEGKIISFIWW
jgi:transcriptional antiterminator NusG